MAGRHSITTTTERARTVRPNDEFDEIALNTMHEETTKTEIEESLEDAEEPVSWEKMAETFEDLETRLAEHFEDTGRDKQDMPPIIKAPERPTKDEWERHQATHAPHAAWCPHCMVARNARRGHPAHGRKRKVVPDTEKGDGPIKVSLDYMYLHERAGKYRDVQHNPPYLVVVEHKYGRCWAHQVPNKGVNDNAHWVPKRVLQHLENSGLGKTRILMKTDQEPSIVCLAKGYTGSEP